MMKDLENIVVGVDSETNIINRQIHGVANDLQNVVENVLQVLQLICFNKSISAYTLPYGNLMFHGL